MTIVDLKIDKTIVENDEFYDVGIENGDFALVEGFSTALQMSMFCERRANETEVAIPYLRRGWWGNITNDVIDYEVGSKIWLTEQAKADNLLLTRVKNYISDSLQWLVDDNHITHYEVTTYYRNNETIVADVNLYRYTDLIANETFELWNNTRTGEL